MNCKQANAIPLSQVLKSMGSAPLGKHSGGDEQWFENPLRDERTASFSINHKKNVWHDFGTGEGGNVIDLVTRHTRKNVSGALEWLDSNLGDIPSINKQSFTEQSKTEKAGRFKILKVQRLLHPLLLDYVAERGMNKAVARQYLNELRYLDTEKNKEYFGLIMRKLVLKLQKALPAQPSILLIWDALYFPHRKIILLIMI